MTINETIERLQIAKKEQDEMKTKGNECREQDLLDL